MSLKLLTIDAKTWEADGAGVVGKEVNIYQSYLGALNKTASDIVVARELNVLTGASGDVITQTAGEVGIPVDNNGMLNIFVDDGGTGEIYIKEVGFTDLVTKVPVNAFGKLGIQRVVVQ